MLISQETELQQVVSIPEMIQNLNKVIADYPDVDPTKMLVEALSESEYGTRLLVRFQREATKEERIYRENLAQDREQRDLEARREHYETLKREFGGG